jgi:hypothetical protein
MPELGTTVATAELLVDQRPPLLALLKVMLAPVQTLLAPVIAGNAGLTVMVVVL